MNFIPVHLLNEFHTCTLLNEFHNCTLLNEFHTCTLLNEFQRLNQRLLSLIRPNAKTAFVVRDPAGIVKYIHLGNFSVC